MYTKTLLSTALVGGLVGTLVVGAGPAQAAAPAAGAQSAGGCSLLTAKQASKVLGSPAHKTHETNLKNVGGAKRSRGCIYAFADGYFGFDANTYPSASLAKKIFKSSAQGTLESTPNLFLMIAANVKVKGFPGFVRAHEGIPGPNDPPITKPYIYNVVVRKGATVYANSFASDNLSSGPMLLAAARIVVARM
ncbi:MAG: hypothetical protein WCP28_18180 [Actinomycetes bacterium]